MQKVLAIVGPTAIGKTSLAIKLAQKLNGEIVSGDSMQVYREVAIGTAKATHEEQAQVKHYLVDTQSVFEPYSVKDFVTQAQSAINAIAAKGKLPLLVGGTGFYVNALLNQMQLGEKDEHETAIAAKWQDFLDQNGPESLWQELNKRDTDAARKIPVANSRRTLRALTVIERTGQKFSQQQSKIEPRYDYLIIGLNSERQEIYRRINLRVDQMMSQGMLEEAEFVYQNRDREHQILQAIGYKEFFPYFKDEQSLPDCVEQLKTASRRYAKRQLTYFRHQLPCHWFDPLNDQNCITEIEEKVEEWLHE
ncbi:tRNA (adenosine(37)-N6)-dimethylallyltransferase MiaA [Lactobacillus sp. ESL0731]|uniref:tRNA (adenosine(37)-N6)-dimethylallyltransferase MiaA n=1 Tax=unclassified Lactobacillus TaxID=2620435 RepID=UPI0023FA1BBE|nr:MULTISPECIES: tRNA (adenosine(37)-N6)-dimethylallyltransferase MiaA [unclassified Lactobacillus]WEV50535.1 tRNA (adenosine(37)-N6)-dimethylallyltransferase MiaA [Lactobacillus sp. ESL0700]WEV61665.1 tRNA (adenosine(37)-N6)-dimethylallyltransferase MiaA [Lactobacillus sp. ESL0731]